MRSVRAFLIGVLVALPVVLAGQQGTWTFQNNGQALITSTPNGTSAVSITQQNASAKALTVSGGQTVDTLTVTGTCTGCTGTGAPIGAAYLVQTATGVGTLSNYFVLTAGANVTLTPGTNTLTIASSGGGGLGTVTNTGGSLTANLPMFGNAGNDSKVGTISGNTTKVVSTTGALVTGDCAKWDAAGNLIDTGATCGGGGSAAGTTNDVQFNGGSGFAADTGRFTYTSTAGLVSPLITSSGYFETRAAKTTTYTLTAADSLVTGDSSGGTFTITLPTAVGISGRQYTVKKIDSSTTVLTVGTTSSQTIDGATTQALIAQGCVITVESNGANWDVKSGTCPGFADPAADQLVYFKNSTKTIATTTAIPSSTTINIPVEYVLPTGIVQAGTATATCSLPSSGAPTATAAASSTGLVGDLAFSGSALNTWECHFPLPHDWQGSSNVDIRYTWRAASTTGNVVWTSKWGVVAAGSTLAGMTYGNTTNVTSAAQGTTLQLQTAVSTGISVTGAAADGELFVQISRNGGTGSDTMTGSAELISARVILRRAVVTGS